MNVISHELRTPLTLIKGGVQTLRRRGDSLPPDQRSDFLDSIEVQSVRLQRMVDQILIVSQIDKSSTGSGAVADLAEIAAAAAARFPPDDRRRLVLDMDSELIVGRKLELAQVTEWIVENALGFSEDLIRIESHVRTSEVLLEITDEGIGMDPDLVRRVLTEPFTQKDSSTTRPHDGLGLSLYAARQVLESMGGALDIDSEPGRGTCVTLRLKRIGSEVGPHEVPAGGVVLGHE